MYQKAIDIFLMLPTNKLIYYFFSRSFVANLGAPLVEKGMNEDTFDNVRGIQQARRGEREQLVVRCKV